MRNKLNLRYCLESSFTVVLWTIWLWSAWMVFSDIQDKTFFEYAEPKFWLFVVASGIVVSLAFLWLVRKPKEKNASAEQFLNIPNHALEEKVLTSFFAVSPDALLLARNAKNLHVDFPFDDHRCQVRFATGNKMPKSIVPENAPRQKRHFGRRLFKRLAAKT